jgi:hypothetical protein
LITDYVCSKTGDLMERWHGHWEVSYCRTLVSVLCQPPWRQTSRKQNLRFWGCGANGLWQPLLDDVDGSETLFSRNCYWCYKPT